MSNLFSITEAAEMLNVHPATLRRWDQDGTLKAIRINDRGDRRYEKTELLRFINANPNLIKYSQEVLYKDYSIQWDTVGFVSYPGRFAVIAQIIVQKDMVKAGFAFIASGTSLFGRSELQKELDTLAIEGIRKYIDDKLIFDEDIYTFEFSNEEFHSVRNPEWWQSAYGKTLCPGLRIVVTSTNSVTEKRNSWRVIVQFKVKQNNIWVTNIFGPNNVFTEYLVYVHSSALNMFGFSNSEKGAETFALEYLTKRFNETKDSNGDRDILRIEENKVACWGKESVKGGELPSNLE